MKKTRKTLAIEALSNGESVEKASELARVSRQTIYNWLEKEDFKRELKERQSAIFQAISKRLLIITSKALDVLEDSLSSRNEHIRIRASAIALSSLKNVIEMTDFEERLTALENNRQVTK